MDDEPETVEAAKKRALKACVARMKTLDLKGKARDDAADHFLAGVFAIIGPDGDPTEKGYLAVLEALAD